MDIGTIRTIIAKRLYDLDTAPRMLETASVRTDTITTPSPMDRDLSYYQQLIDL